MSIPMQNLAKLPKNLLPLYVRILNRFSYQEMTLSHKNYTVRQLYREGTALASTHLEMGLTAAGKYAFPSLFYGNKTVASIL